MIQILLPLVLFPETAFARVRSAFEDRGLAPASKHVLREVEN